MFENLRVLELASVLAGPLSGTFFAELGAEVIKVENKRTGGDVTRSWKLDGEKKDLPVSAYYAAANFNKTVVFLDLTDADDFSQMLEYLKTSDIVILNYKPGDAEKLGLDYKSIRVHNPEIIYAEINGFGADSPRVAFDVVLQAESGFMHINGEPGAKPLKMPVALIDILAAHQLKQGILCALLKKQQTGKGSKVEVSLYDAAISSLANQATNWLMNGQAPKAIGSLHPNIAPYGDMFQTADERWIVFAVGSDAQFSKLWNTLSLHENGSFEKFSSNPFRLENRAKLQEILRTAIKRQPVGYWVEKFDAQHIPYGIVRNFQEVFDSPNAKDLILEEVQEGVHTRRVRSAVFKIQNDN